MRYLLLRHDREPTDDDWVYIAGGRRARRRQSESIRPKARPFALVIEAGASENHIDFGGLPITRLQLSHGAGAVDVVMSELKLAVGAGKTDAYKLGNANFQTLLVEGGAAGYVLDFTGSTLKAATARISAAPWPRSRHGFRGTSPSKSPAKISSAIRAGMQDLFSAATYG